MVPPRGSLVAAFSALQQCCFMAPNLPDTTEQPLDRRLCLKRRAVNHIQQPSVPLWGFFRIQSVNRETFPIVMKELFVSVAVKRLVTTGFLAQLSWCVVVRSTTANGRLLINPKKDGL